MTSSKSNKHSLITPTKSKKLSSMAEAPSNSKKPSKMAPKLHQPPHVVKDAAREENQSESESDSESGSESDSDSEESANEIAFIVKPVVSEKSADPKTSTPVVNHASSSKRSAESEAVPNESKRKKLTDNGDEHDAKKNRVWTEEDELAIFNGLIAYQKRKKGLFTNADTGDFHQFIKKNLHQEADDRKLSNKIRKLKSKYFSKGLDQVFTRPHDIEMIELSKKIWGAQDNVVGNSGRRSNQKPKSGSVSEPNVAEMKEEVKFSGGVKKEPDNFWLQYPSLNLCLSSQTSWDLSSQLRQKIPMLGNNKSTKLEELEKEWSDIQITELELGYKKIDARMKLIKFVLDSCSKE